MPTRQNKQIHCTGREGRSRVEGRFVLASLDLDTVTSPETGCFFLSIVVQTFSFPFAKQRTSSPSSPSSPYHTCTRGQSHIYTQLHTLCCRHHTNELLGWGMQNLMSFGLVTMLVLSWPSCFYLLIWLSMFLLLLWATFFFWENDVTGLEPQE